MAYSQNGWSASWDVMASFTVPSADVRITLRKGDTSVILLWLMEQYHKRVEPLRQKDTGGYNPRSIIGARTLSNHASGTACDTNWQTHPMGKRGTFTAAQRREIREILAYLEGVVRWGGNYRSVADDMHWEIVGSPTACRRVADKIRGRAAVKPVKVKPVTMKVPDFPGQMHRGLMDSTRVRKLQARLKQRGWSIIVDGDYGPGTEKIVKLFQKDKKLKVDGIVGPKTWAAVWSAPITK